MAHHVHPRSGYQGFRSDSRREIIYVGGFLFPEGSASAARVLGIGKALRDAGYTVMFAGGEEEGRLEDLRPGEGYFYQGFPYHSTGEIPARPMSLLKRTLRHLTMGRNTELSLRSMDVTRVAAIVLYNPLMGYHLRLHRFCRRNGIALVVDCTEWHDPTHYLGGRLGPQNWDVEFTMRYLNQRAGNLIAISSYLERFYRDRQVRVIRIPPLVDLADAKWANRRLRPWDEQPLRLVYAGRPGHKDLLVNVLAGLWKLLNEGRPAVLELIGPTQTEIRSLLGECQGLLENLGESLVLRGRVAQSQVPRLLSQADLGVLLRPDKRYAHAGFPTKLVEYLAAGLPVVTNATSDIAEYVQDNVTGILVRDCSEDAFADGICRAMETGPERLREMSAAARQRAEQSFDYRNYVSLLGEFFSQLTGSETR